MILRPGDFGIWDRYEMCVTIEKKECLVSSLSKQDALCFRILVHEVHTVLSAESGVSNSAEWHLRRENKIFIYRPYARDAYLGILLSEQQPKSVGYLVYPNRMLFASVYSYTKSMPFSLPNPEFPTPPNGISGGKMRCLLTHTTPALSSSAYL